MTLIAYAFPKFQTERGVVGYMTKKLHLKSEIGLFRHLSNQVLSNL